MPKILPLEAYGDSQNPFYPGGTSVKVVNYYITKSVWLTKILQLACRVDNASSNSKVLIARNIRNEIIGIMDLENRTGLIW